MEKHEGLRDSNELLSAVLGPPNFPRCVFEIHSLAVEAEDKSRCKKKEKGERCRRGGKLQR